MAVIQAIEQKTSYRTYSVSYTLDQRKEIRQVREVNSLDSRNGDRQWLIT